MGTRAGTLVAAASLVTSFLGGQVLVKPTLANGKVATVPIGGWGWLAGVLLDRGRHASVFHHPEIQLDEKQACGGEVPRT